jgi:hypothetical protein
VHPHIRKPCKLEKAYLKLDMPSYMGGVFYDSPWLTVHGLLKKFLTGESTVNRSNFPTWLSCFFLPSARF